MSFIQTEHEIPYADYAFGVAEEVGDNIEEAIRYYTERMGPIAHMRQVHGDRVVYASKPGLYEEADALYTDHHELWLAVKTADCVPVLISTPRAIAAVHCGWRGLKSEILPKTIQVLINEFHANPTEIFLHIGPCIRQENYEVEESFTHDFDEKFFAPSKKAGKVMMNLPAVVRHQAMELGINDLNINDSDLCTFAEDELFHSYRRAKIRGENNYRVQMSMICRDVEE